MMLKTSLNIHLQAGNGILAGRWFVNVDIFGYHHWSLVYRIMTWRQHRAITYAETFKQGT